MFCISSVQASPSYGSDVQTSSASHSLAQQIKRSDFVFCVSWVQTSPLYGSDVQTSSISYLLPPQSDVQISSSAYQAFRLPFIWIRCSDFICITFSSTTVRRSDFVFCISGVQTSPSYGSDVQTSSASHSLAQQIRRLDFVFYVSGIQTSSSYGSDVQTSFISHSLAPQSSVQTSSSAYQAFRLRLYMDKMFILYLHHIR